MVCADEHDEINAKMTSLLLTVNYQVSPHNIALVAQFKQKTPHSGTVPVHSLPPFIGNFVASALHSDAPGIAHTTSNPDNEHLREFLILGP
eukprot:5672100-Amphidinium_carterae.1